MTDYEFAQVTGVCSITQRELQEGESFYAVLFETPEGFQRQDTSLEAWEGPPQGYFSYWKSQIPTRTPQKRLFVDKEILIDMFVRLADNTEPVKLHFRFVLALILMRKRLLKYEQTVMQDGAEYWRMRLTAQQSDYLVLNPRLSDEEIERVSKELGAVLHGDRGAFVEDRDVPEPAPEADSQEMIADAD